MPFNSVWDQRNKTAAMIIPLLMQRKRDEQELTLKARALKLEEDKLRALEAEKSAELNRKIEEAQTKNLVDMWKAMHAGGDEEGIQPIGRELDRRGLPVSKKITPSPAAQDMSYDEPYLDQATLKPNLRYLVKPTVEKPERPITLSPGQIAVHPTTGTQIASGAPKEDKPKDDILTLNGIVYQIGADNTGKKTLTNIGGNEKPKTKEQLTMAALSGDQEAQQIIKKMGDQEIQMAERKGKASTKGKLAGLKDVMDIDGATQAVINGRETIENVRNTFGVPIQEIVRAGVLKEDPNFNFVQPRAMVNSLKSSLMQQQKNRGMMGSFVKNINGQVDRLETISSDIVKRIGVRFLDLPKREILTRIIGSGQEQVMSAYMKEISAEIAKLSQGSAASIAQLPEENRKEWEKIHDPSLSMRELLIILNGTREMANIRLGSVDDEINETVDQLGNVRTKRNEESKDTKKRKFKIIKVE